MTLLSIFVTLVLVLDPIGNIPMFLSALRDVPPERRSRIILRESGIAYLLLVLFLFGGAPLMHMLAISGPSITISGGIILFIIALRMIFPSKDGIFGTLPRGEPFIFPLAVPLFAGPSAMATIILFASKSPAQWPMILVAITLASAVATLILLGSPRLMRFMGERGINAAERLMGLLLTVISVEMLLSGLTDVFGIDF